jgi:hypothetical protein
LQAYDEGKRWTMCLFSELLAAKKSLTSPWIAGEEKLCQANEILKHEIDLNDFRDFVE